jgi:hypothetical protein
LGLLLGCPGASARGGLTLPTVHLCHCLRDGLRAATPTFLNTSAPKMLAQTGKKAPLTSENVTYSGHGPFAIEVALKAKRLLLVAEPHYELPEEEIDSSHYG